MSIGRTNSGSGGALSLSKPLIHITAILGSDIEISLGGVIVKAIPSSKAIPNINGISAEYYYSAPATGTYTITATKGSRSLSKTLAVSEVKQYDISVNILIIYDLGDENVSVTGGIVKQKGIDNSGYAVGTLTKNADNIALDCGSAQAVAAVTANSVNLSGYTTIFADVSYYNVTQKPRLVLSNRALGDMASYQAMAEIYGTGVTAMDISSISGTGGYVSFRNLSSSGQSVHSAFTKIWAEG